mgnify:CR=1 FL=1
MQQQQTSTRFTLVELLAAMAIIIILMGLIIAGSSTAWQKKNTAQIRSRLQQMEAALDEYQQDWGYYPQTNGNVKNIDGWFVYGNASTSSAGLQEPGGSGESWGHYYLNPDKLSWKEQGGSKGDWYWQDPWLEPIKYECPGEMNKQSFDLWSKGPDEKHGDGGSSVSDARTTKENDDITNWKQR